MSEKSSNRLAILALVVSAASASFALGSFLVSDAALRQDREAVLTAQRVEACAVLSRHAADAQADGAGALNWLNVEGDRSARFLEARAAMLHGVVNFSEASVLTFLGPPSLASAQDNLKGALDDAFLEMNRDGATAAEMEAALEASFRARIDFQSACISAVGRFRD